MRMTIHSTLSEIIWKRSSIIYKTVLIRHINGFTKIIRYLIQQNVFFFVSKITLKMNHSYCMKSCISELCKKASQKIESLSRLSSYLHIPEKKLIFNLIIKSQFSYCPLVWMFCSRTSNNMINKLHERSLRIILNDYSSDFNILLENNNHIWSHHRNIQALLTEVFKLKSGLAPPIMESILNKRFKTYNLRNFQEFATERKRTDCYGLEKFNDRYPQPWSRVAGKPQRDKFLKPIQKKY